MALSPDQANDLRRRILAGEEPTEDEMKLVVDALIADRSAIVDAAGTPKVSKKNQPKINLDDLMSEPE